MKWLSLLVVLFAVGCRGSTQNLPTVEWKDEADALRILRERAAAVRTLSATGSIALKRPSGESVRLDLAMASKPDHLRLRAWKLGRAVFDLTLTPQGLWLFTPEDPALRDKARRGGLDAGKLARSWKTFTGGLFNTPGLRLNAGLYEAMIDDAAVRCEVDRRTLTPVRYTIGESFSLRLDDYRMIESVPHPFRYEAESPTGTIKIQLREVELNGELAPGAFTPPRRAEKLQ